MDAGKGSVARVKAALADCGIAAEIRTFDQSTRTAAEAAAAIHCQVAQIAKSLVFKTQSSDLAIVVIASGSSRVDEAALAKHVGEAVQKADATFVRERTGFSIGGVAPVGHTNPVRLVIDTQLLAFEEIWAAAGSPNAVFRLRPEDLRRLPGAQFAAICAASAKR